MKIINSKYKEDLLLAEQSPDGTETVWIADNSDGVTAHYYSRRVFCLHEVRQNTGYVFLKGYKTFLLGSLTISISNDGEITNKKVDLSYSEFDKYELAVSMEQKLKEDSGLC